VPVVRRTYSVKPIEYTDDVVISDGSIFVAQLPISIYGSFDGAMCEHPWLKKIVDSENVRKIFPNQDHARIVIREKRGEKIIKVISDRHCSSITHKIPTTKIVLLCILGLSAKQKLWKITLERSPSANKDKHISYLKCGAHDMFESKCDKIESDSDSDDGYTCVCAAVYRGCSMYCYKHDQGYDSW
jgi:hypothetical protein